MIGRFLKDESGATVVEYGLIAALIAVTVIGGMTFVGSSINGQFNRVADTVNP